MRRQQEQKMPCNAVVRVHFNHSNSNENRTIYILCTKKCSFNHQRSTGKYSLVHVSQSMIYFLVACTFRNKAQTPRALKLAQFPRGLSSSVLRDWRPSFGERWAWFLSCITVLHMTYVFSRSPTAPRAEEYNHNKGERSNMRTDCSCLPKPKTAKKEHFQSLFSFI